MTIKSKLEKILWVPFVTGALVYIGSQVRGETNKVYSEVAHDVAAASALLILGKKIHDINNSGYSTNFAKELRDYSMGVRK